MEDDNALLNRLLGEITPVQLHAYQLSPVHRHWNSCTRSNPDLALERSEHLFDDVLPWVSICFRQRRSRSANRGWQSKFPSSKMKRTVMARSHLELRLIELCEVDGAVSRYVEQPIRIRYMDHQGKARAHTPDLFIEREEDAGFVEVKWEADARKDSNESRWPLIAEAITSLGYSYTVMTERHIMAQPLAANVAKLLRHRKSPQMSDLVAGQVRDRLILRPGTMEQLLSWYPDVSAPSLFRAIADGWLRTDMNLPLGLESEIRPGIDGTRVP